MGSSLSAIYDDYDDYEHFCGVLKIKPLSIYGSFYDHQNELLADLGFKHLMDYYAAVRKAAERDKQINSILE